MLENPRLLEHEQALQSVFGYPQDVIERARRLLRDVKSVGAYSLSQGVPSIRASVARFIEGEFEFVGEGGALVGLLL